MDKILLIKTSALGDIVHVYPAVSYLKAKFPNAEIDWVVEEFAIDLVKAHPDIHRAIPIATKTWRKALMRKETWKQVYSFREDLRRSTYDIAFDFQGNTKSGLIMAQVKSALKVGFGWQTAPEKPNLLFTNLRFDPSTGLNIREDYLSLAINALGDENVTLPPALKVELKISEEERKVVYSIVENLRISEGLLVLVCPGSAWKNKQMTIEALACFLKKVEYHYPVQFLFVWGSQGEKLIAEDLQRKFSSCSIVLQKLSLPMLQNLMGLCDLVIAMDSLPLHLAGSTKTPSFSVFGASSANKYKPLGSKHIAYQGACPYGKTFTKRCPILRSCTTGACIRNLSDGEVFDAFSSSFPTSKFIIS